MALLDHLEIDQAVIGGTSLGANTALQPAPATPSGSGAWWSRCRCSTTPCSAVGAIFTPILLALRFGAAAASRRLASLTRRVPRTQPTRSTSGSTGSASGPALAAVLEGLFLGAAAPHHDERVQDAAARR